MSNRKQALHSLTYEQECALIAAYRAGVGRADLARRFAISPRTVDAIRTYHQVVGRAQYPTVILDPEWAAYEYYRRGSLQRMADLLGCSRPTIRKALVRAGVAVSQRKRAA